MSGKNRAARRRAERKYGGPPPDYWNDYRRPLVAGIALLVIAVLVTGFLIVRSRQDAQAEVDAYCQVYDQTHDDITSAKTTTTTTTQAPGTTVAPPGSTPPDSSPDAAPTTTAPATGPTGTTPTGTTPGTAVDAGTSTTTTTIDTNARIKSAVDKRSQVGPQKVRDAWATLGKVFNGTKLTATQQADIQAARTTVNDFAKNECKRDPPDL